MDETARAASRRLVADQLSSTLTLLLIPTADLQAVSGPTLQRYRTLGEKLLSPAGLGQATVPA